MEADVWTLALGKQDDSVPFSSSEGKAGLSVYERFGCENEISCLSFFTCVLTFLWDLPSGYV